MEHTVQQRKSCQAKPTPDIPVKRPNVLEITRALPSILPNICWLLMLPTSEATRLLCRSCGTDWLLDCSSWDALHIDPFSSQFILLSWRSHPRNVSWHILSALSKAWSVPKGPQHETSSGSTLQSMEIFIYPVTFQDSCITSPILEMWSKSQIELHRRGDCTYHVIKCQHKSHKHQGIKFRSY